jgi:hypothetical protein
MAELLGFKGKSITVSSASEHNQKSSMAIRNCGFFPPESKKYGACHDIPNLYKLNKAFKERMDRTICKPKDAKAYMKVNDVTMKEVMCQNDFNVYDADHYREYHNRNITTK